MVRRTGFDDWTDSFRKWKADIGLDREITSSRSASATSTRRRSSKFHRAHGAFKGEPYSVLGERLSLEDHRRHLGEVLPTEADGRILGELFRERDWIQPVG